MTYGVLDINDDNLNKIYAIYHKDIQFVNNDGFDLFEVPDEPGCNSTANVFPPLMMVFIEFSHTS